MLLGYDPGLKGKACGVGTKRNEGIVLSDHTGAVFFFKCDSLTKKAFSLFGMELLHPFYFFQNVFGYQRGRDELAVRMGQGSPGDRPVILEQLGIFDPLIFFQVQVTRFQALNPKNVFFRFFCRMVMIGVLRSLHRRLHPAFFINSDLVFVLSPSICRLQTCWGRPLRPAVSVGRPVPCRQEFPAASYVHYPGRRAASRVFSSFLMGNQKAFASFLAIITQVVRVLSQFGHRKTSILKILLECSFLGGFILLAFRDKIVLF